MGQEPGSEESEVVLEGSDGARVPAFIAAPTLAREAPKVVIAPEVFGLSPWIRSVARKLAQEGFRAIAVEIFARDPLPAGTEMPELIARMHRLAIPQVVRDLQTALARLPGGKAGSIGFCLGGSLSLMLAAQGGLDASVACYGRIRWTGEPGPLRPEHPIDAAKRIRCPVLGIYGNRDPGIPASVAEALRAALPPGSEVALYDAGHAFLNDTRPQAHVASQATLAWSKIVGFLRRNLG